MSFCVLVFILFLAATALLSIVIGSILGREHKKKKYKKDHDPPFRNDPIDPSDDNYFY